MHQQRAGIARTGDDGFDELFRKAAAPMRGIDVHAEQMALVPFLGTGSDLQPGQANQIIPGKSTEACEPRGS